MAGEAAAGVGSGEGGSGGAVVAGNRSSDRFGGPNLAGGFRRSCLVDNSCEV